MGSVTGTNKDLSNLKGLDVIEFRILETVFRNGKVEIVLWEAKIN